MISASPLILMDDNLISHSRRHVRWKALLRMYASNLFMLGCMQGKQQINKNDIKFHIFENFLFFLSKNSYSNKKDFLKLSLV